MENRSKNKHPTGAHIARFYLALSRSVSLTVPAPQRVGVKHFAHPDRSATSDRYGEFDQTV